MIVVTGIGIVSALGIGVAENYNSLKSSKCGLGKISNFQTNHDVPVGELKFTNEELKAKLGIPSRKKYSRTSLLGMLAAKEALENANISSGRVGLISATSVGGMDITETIYPNMLENGSLSEIMRHDSADSTLCIAKYLNIKDFTTTISTACSSSANAIMLGCRMLNMGLLDYVVVGGTDALCKFTLNGFKSLRILDDKECRPFCNTRAGLNLGEGAAYLVLERESEKPNYGKVLGYANANDATHQTATSDEGEGAFRSMKNALAKASLTPSDIDYINVHGTATGNNDLSEGNAIKRIFTENVPHFSSTKAFTGHCLAAAGSIEAVFSLLSIKYGAIFPNLNFSEPIEHELIPHSEYSENNEINTVMSNSFGFGGNCSTLIFGK
jgi:3-oxoacyl-[acyl-carrier-protein] synthase-1